MEIERIKGITVSKTSDQFVVHGSEGEYDYLLISPQKATIVEKIETAYEDLTEKELLFTIINHSDLSGFVTGKKEKKKDPRKSKMLETDLIDIQEYIVNKGEINLEAYATNAGLTAFFKKHQKYKESSLDNFEILQLIGKGRGSMVFTAKSKEDNKVYALKIIDKVYIIENNLLDEVILEKNILCSFDNPFFAELQYYFQTDDKIVFVMTFYRGGDLFQHLIKKKTIGETNVAFYGAQIAFMLDTLHKKNIMYRDLKPENILMGDNGYLRLIDFGLCRTLDEQDKISCALCGSPQYMAPEVIKGEGHNQSSDWWSFGVLLYELFCGFPPFNSDYTEHVFDLITSSELRFPSKKKLSENFKDLLKKVRLIILPF